MHTGVGAALGVTDSVGNADFTFCGLGVRLIGAATAGCSRRSSSEPDRAALAPGLGDGAVLLKGDVARLLAKDADAFAVAASRSICSS